MPKVIIEFNLPEEDNDFKMAVNANKYYSALFDTRTKIRNLIKYNYKDSFDVKTAEHIQQCFFDILENIGINLDEVE